MLFMQQAYRFQSGSHLDQSKSWNIWRSRRQSWSGTFRSSTSCHHLWVRTHRAAICIMDVVSFRKLRPFPSWGTRRCIFWQSPESILGSQAPENQINHMDMQGSPNPCPCNPCTFGLAECSPSQSHLIWMPRSRWAQPSYLRSSHQVFWQGYHLILQWRHQKLVICHLLHRLLMRLTSWFCWLWNF